MCSSGMHASGMLPKDIAFHFTFLSFLYTRHLRERASPDESVIAFLHRAERIRRGYKNTTWSQLEIDDLTCYNLISHFSTLELSIKKEERFKEVRILRHFSTSNLWHAIHIPLYNLHSWTLDINHIKVVNVTI